jgi:hypothetical protein
VTQAAVSHEHKFIFLKTKKTAGTSIELALTQLCRPDYIIRAAHPDRRGTAYNWARFAELLVGIPAAPLVQIPRRIIVNQLLTPPT